MITDQPMQVETFIVKLLERGFKQAGPTTLVYTDPRDTVTVFIAKEVVIITGDGPYVTKSWNIIQRREGPDTFFWEVVYQDVVHKF